MSEPVGRQRSGIASAASLTPEQRVARGKHAVGVRWKKSEPQRALRRFLRTLATEYHRVFWTLPDKLIELTCPLLILDAALESKERNNNVHPEV